MRRVKVNMRLPEDLLAWVDAEAERRGQTRTKFVERAVASALDTRPISKAQYEGRPIPAGDPTHVFQCRSRACDYTAGSPNAICPQHGRKVVPITHPAF